MAQSKYFYFFGDNQLQNILKKDEITAIQKFSKGLANEYEQKLAYKTIVEKICRIAHSSFNPDSGITNFNEGARWVGVMLAQAIVVNTDLFLQDTPIKPTNINNK